MVVLTGVTPRLSVSAVGLIAVLGKKRPNRQAAVGLRHAISLSGTLHFQAEVFHRFAGFFAARARKLPLFDGGQDLRR